jgi:glyoxylase-like metal-dependent hydrolase (beta-lactamase superfamily II)
MLDGGAMFGVVPKTLWSKQVPSDALNRIPMVMRCLLIHSSASGRFYLVDTGNGSKFDEKQRAIYAYDDTEVNLVKSLASFGLTPDVITDVLFTHLHFDHCGGASAWSADLQATEPVFKNARYWVNRRHWETATQPNAREKASFLKENLACLHDPERLHLNDDEASWEHGLGSLTMNGHTQGMQLPWVENDRGERLVYAADLIPMAAHVPLPWVMAYDMHPTQTLQEKATFLQQAAEKHWYLFLEHDASHQIVTILHTAGRFEVDQHLTLDQLF